jgi:hypothetical protein
MVSLVDGSEFLVKCRESKTGLAGVTDFVSYKSDPFEGIALSWPPEEWGFGLAVPELLGCLLSVLAFRQRLERMIWQSMLLK